MNEAVSFSDRLGPRIEAARTIKAFVDKLISLLEKNKYAPNYEINDRSSKYLVNAGFADLKLFKENLEVDCLFLAGEMPDTCSIKPDFP